jgi:hypothetical protein
MFMVIGAARVSFLAGSGLASPFRAAMRGFSDPSAMTAVCLTRLPGQRVVKIRNASFTYPLSAANRNHFNASVGSFITP